MIIKIRSFSNLIRRAHDCRFTRARERERAFFGGFGEEEKQDPLHTALQNRIEELNEDIDTDNDDDDGGAPVPALR